MFRWGIKRGVGKKDKDVQYYQSFIYYDVEYFLHDYVYLDNNDADAYIGKLVGIFETPEHEKKVKVVWLFRPAEIRNFLRDYQPRWNELFLACGQDKGFSNVNSVKSIIGKCNVVCASRDRRNPPPSEEQLRMADFIFYHCFDVGECRIVKKFADDDINGIKVECFFNNWKAPKETTPAEVDGHRARGTFNSNSLVVQGTGSKKRVASLVVQEDISDDMAMLKLKNPTDPTENDRSTVLPVKKRRLLLDEKAAVISEEVGPHAAGGMTTVSKIGTMTKSEKARWFNQKQLPWLERLKKAEEAGTLVLLENLDPTLTSSEVEDLVRHAFDQTVEAKMIQWTTCSNPYYGKAFVIFESKAAAVSAVTKLQGSCLVMEDGRSIYGRKGSVNDHGKIISFNGHLSRHKLKQRQSEEMRKAVSTSHFAQQNTLEFGMAVEWLLVQAKTDMMWNDLRRNQAREIESVKRRLKRKEKEEEYFELWSNPFGQFTGFHPFFRVIQGENTYTGFYPFGSLYVMLVQKEFASYITANICVHILHSSK
ncbi:protein ANTI-SILENCING 1 [Euphorbia lathyris]|uniref:protein ANTI-SILENCING 1 n=1 Tax=Euphorbia lathyris TaxID=212925 RepID=UPI0033141FD8